MGFINLGGGGSITLEPANYGGEPGENPTNITPVATITLLGGAVLVSGHSYSQLYDGSINDGTVLSLPAGGTPGIRLEWPEPVTISSLLIKGGGGAYSSYRQPRIVANGVDIVNETTGGITTAGKTYDLALAITTKSLEFYSNVSSDKSDITELCVYSTITGYPNDPPDIVGYNTDGIYKNVTALKQSAGTDDEGKLVALGAGGKIDPSLLPSVSSPPQVFVFNLVNPIADTVMPAQYVNKAGVLKAVRVASTDVTGAKKELSPSITVSVCKIDSAGVVSELWSLSAHGISGADPYTHNSIAAGEYIFAKLVGATSGAVNLGITCVVA